MSTVTVSGPIDTKYPNDPYGTHKSKKGVGGAQTGFASINEVYAIPVDKREPLMIVSIMNYGGEPALFWLKVTVNDPLLLADNNNWDLLPIGAVVGGGVIYKGNFSAVTGQTESGDTISDPPSLSPTGTLNGDFFVCNEAGTIDFGSGNQTFNNLDYVIYDGTIWRRLQGSSITDWNSISNMPQIIKDIGDGTFVPANQQDLTAATNRITILEANQLYVTNSITQQSQLVTTEEAVINYAYSKDYIDALFLAVPSTDIIDFNWARAIKRLPKIGETPNGNTVQEGLESIYYNNIEPSIVINAVDPKEVGYNRTSIVTGSVNPNQTVEITRIEIRDADTETVITSVTPAAPPTITTINETMPSLLIVEGENRKYKITVGYKLETGDDEVLLDSDVRVLNGIYPILYGAGDGLGSADIYANLSKLIIGKESFRVNITSSNQDSYIGYPDDYGNLTTIGDNGEEEMIDTLFPATPVTISVQNTLADSPWTKDYLFYISQYKHSSTSFEYNAKYVDEGFSGTLDDISDGALSTKMLYGERDSISYLMGESVNWMLKSKYSALSSISGVEGIADKSVELVVVGKNEGTIDIPKGRYVTPIGISTADFSVIVKIADKDSNDTAEGFANEVIPANGGKGVVVVRGFNAGIDTSGQQIGDEVYLGQNGTVQYTPPTSGSFMKVGDVLGVGNPGLIASFTYRNALTANFQANWRANTFYRFGTKIGATYPAYPDVGSFILRTKQDVAPTTIFDPDAPGFWDDYEVLGGEMKISMYDPDRIRGDAFDRDSMKDGTNADPSIRAVRFTQTDKDKLTNVQDPIYLGTFNNPTELRAEYPTSASGSEATVLSTTTTWSYVTNSTNDWVDTGIAVGGDMTKNVYDPSNIAANAFDLDNMVQGTNINKLFFTQAEKDKLFAFSPASSYYTTIQTDGFLAFKSDTTYVDTQDALKMSISTYDPNTIAGDAFAMVNMVEEPGVVGTEKKILLQSERVEIAKQVIRGGIYYDSGGVTPLVVSAGEVAPTTTLFASVDNADMPANGRLRSTKAGKVTVVASLSVEMSANTTQARFQVAVSGVVVAGAFATAQRGNAPSLNNPTITVPLTLALNDYVSIIMSGSNVDLYDMTITINGRE